MFKRILIPLDGSELGELALPYAEELAKTFNSGATRLTNHIWAIEEIVKLVK